MHADVFFGAAQMVPGDVAGRVVAVIDVLRASTTITVALANGARNVIPFASPEDAVAQSKSLERSLVRLAGERRMLAIEGFDLGNSPREFTPEMVRGRTILFATTNGTAALLGLHSAREVVIASYVNVSAVSKLLRAAARGGTDVTIVCAGSERHFALEDAACAGRLVRYIRGRLPAAVLNDAAHACALLDRRYGDNLVKLFADSTHGRALVQAGFAGDLEVCGAIDSYAVVPVYEERQIGLRNQS